MYSQSPEAYYRQLPPVTRFIATAVLVSTVLTSFNFIHPAFITLDWFLVLYKFHVWRLITNILYIGNFGFAWFIQMYLFVSFSTRLEQNLCYGRRQNSGAYLYFLTIIVILLDLFSILIRYPEGLPTVAPALTYAILYYWCRREAYVPVNFWGFTLAAWQLPFALFIIDILTGHSIYDDLLGLAAGHTYYFLKDVWIYTKNLSCINNPPIIFESITAQLDFFNNQQPQTQQGQPEPRYSNRFPGRGQRLYD